MGKEGKPQGVNGKMPLNPISGFVETEAFGLDTRGTGIFDRLRINDD